MSFYYRSVILTRLIPLVYVFYYNGFRLGTVLGMLECTKIGPFNLTIENSRLSAICWKPFLVRIQWKRFCYRMIVEMMQERGLKLTHTTIMRWVHQYSPIIDKRIRKHLKPTNLFVCIKWLLIYCICWGLFYFE